MSNAKREKQQAGRKGEDAVATRGPARKRSGYPSPLPAMGRGDLNEGAITERERERRGLRAQL